MRMSDSRVDPDQELVEVEAEVIDTPASLPDLELDLPDDAEAAAEVLMTELAGAKATAESHLADLKRVAADFENYRKRTTREGAEVMVRAVEQVVMSLLPVLDSFDAALEAANDDEERLLHQGMIATRTQLLDALASRGLEVIPTVDEVFDPEIHEPVGAPDGDGQLVVAAELRRGYRLNGRVLRAALVTLETGS